MATVKQVLHRKNSSGSYDTINLQTSADMVKTTDNTTVQEEINSLKSSVSNGKSLVAAAITDKGVSTASDATFQTMASNIGSISTGVNFGVNLTCNGCGALATVTATNITNIGNDFSAVSNSAGVAVIEIKYPGYYIITSTMKPGFSIPDIYAFENGESLTCVFGIPTFTYTGIYDYIDYKTGTTYSTDPSIDTVCLRLKTSGSITFSSAFAADVFLCGGGAGGNNMKHSTAATNGGNTTAFGNTANGGAIGSGYNGGNGGSGGGHGAGGGVSITSAGPGASNGNNAQSATGSYSTAKGGTGQGTTTRAFGLSDGLLFAAGGGVSGGRSPGFSQTWPGTNAGDNTGSNGVASYGSTPSNAKANFGGGGASGGSYIQHSQLDLCGGSGGGYTKNITNYNISKNTNYNITIGDGGTGAAKWQNADQDEIYGAGSNGGSGVVLIKCH